MAKFSKINKKCIPAIVVYAICLVAYILVFLLIPFTKNATSWISFGATIFAIIVGCGVFLFAFSVKQLKSAVYGIPIFKVGLIYSAVQLVCGIIFCIIAAFVNNIPVWICLIVYILLLAVFAVGLIITGSARSAIESLEQGVVDRTSAMRAIHNSLLGLEAECDGEVKQQFAKLLEDVKYSDPVSVKKSEDIENEIIAIIDDFKLNGGDIVAVISKLELLIKERNQICKSFKR